jgi:hypothetical protein
MQNNKNLEVEYIIELISKQDYIENLTPGYKLNLNDKVRLIEKNKTLLKKTRYNVTPFYFNITDINGKQITISAADGSVKNVTRSRIIPVDLNNNVIKQSKTITSGNVSRGIISEILNYNPKNDTYNVKYEMPNDNEPYIDHIKSKELRANKPLIYSKLELEFFDKKSKKA